MYERPGFWVRLIWKIAARLGFMNINYPMIHGPADRLKLGSKVGLTNTIFNTRSGNIVIGDNSFFGHNCMVLTGRHLYVNGFPKLPRSEQVPTQGFDIVIGENCWIASGAILIGPLRIGSNSIIGAGAVVTKDVEPFSFVGCSPAKFIKKLKEEA